MSSFYPFDEFNDAEQSPSYLPKTNKDIDETQKLLNELNTLPSAPVHNPSLNTLPPAPTKKPIISSQDIENMKEMESIKKTIINYYNSLKFYTKIGSKYENLRLALKTYNNEYIKNLHLLNLYQLNKGLNEIKIIYGTFNKMGGKTKRKNRKTRKSKTFRKTIKSKTSRKNIKLNKI